MNLPTLPTVDRFLLPLVGTTVLLGLLLLWQGTYAQSCVALATPALVYIAILRAAVLMHHSCVAAVYASMPPRIR